MAVKKIVKPSKVIEPAVPIEPVTVAAPLKVGDWVEIRNYAIKRGRVVEVWRAAGSRWQAGLPGPRPPEAEARLHRVEGGSGDPDSRQRISPGLPNWKT